MAKPTYIQPYGAKLMVMMDDGTQYLAIKSSGTTYIISGTTGDPTPPDPGNGQYSWPFPPANIWSEYGARTGPIGSFHEGCDFSGGPAVHGAKEFASMDGTVEAINLNSNYGYSVQLKHALDSKGNRIRTIYAHMESQPVVHAGQSVKKGDLLGYLGDTGDPAPGAYHLHWETHTCPNDGPIVHNTSNTHEGLTIRTAINPRDFMKTYGDGKVLNS